MHSRNQILGAAELCLEHGEPVPLDTLAQADDIGLLLTDLGEPHQNNHEGETIHGKSTEDDIHDL